MMTGTFITVEGPEGSGKTMQIEMLTRRLKSEGHDVIRTKEPGGTPLADSIRAILLDSGNVIDPIAELLLFGASRRQHIAEVIRPALERGSIVLCDRFYDSTRAYQGYGRGLPLEMINAIQEYVVQGVHPDGTILLSSREVVPMIEKARWRNASNGGSEDRFEKEEMEFHVRVNEGYFDLARKEPERFCYIDVLEHGAYRSRGAIHADVYKVAKQVIDRR